MALEAVVYQQGLFGYNNCKEWYNVIAAGGLSCEFEPEFEENKQLMPCDEINDIFDKNWDHSCSNSVQKLENLSPHCTLNCQLSSETYCRQQVICVPVLDAQNELYCNDNETIAGSIKKKRRCTKTVKNKEQVESQRMTHIAVERNRRKQMNDYLAVLRSLIPASRAQKSDQASIVGGAINYVKELEQLLQSLEVQKRLKQQTEGYGLPFADFFTYPQYSCCSSACNGNNSNTSGFVVLNTSHCGHEKMAENHSEVADIEVTMVESHASLKVLSRRQPRQLVKLIAGLQDVRLMPMHLNVTTVEQMVLYSFSLKVEDGCLYTSVDDIATAVYKMLERIQEMTKLIN